jgi:hypothetical protein
MKPLAQRDPHNDVFDGHRTEGSERVAISRRTLLTSKGEDENDAEGGLHEDNGREAAAAVAAAAATVKYDLGIQVHRRSTNGK